MKKVILKCKICGKVKQLGMFGKEWLIPIEEETRMINFLVNVSKTAELWDKSECPEHRTKFSLSDLSYCDN